MITFPKWMWLQIMQLCKHTDANYLDLGEKSWARDLSPSGAEDITYLPARFSLKSFFPVFFQPGGGLIHCWCCLHKLDSPVAVTLFRCKPLPKQQRGQLRGRLSWRKRHARGWGIDLYLCIQHFQHSRRFPCALFKPISYPRGYHSQRLLYRYQLVMSVLVLLVNGIIYYLFFWAHLLLLNKMSVRITYVVTY